MSLALVTGASRGLGRALALALAARGASLVLDARGADALHTVAAELRADPAAGTVVALPGDVADPAHRQELAAAVRTLGPLDLLIANASSLGPSPLPRLARYPLDDLTRVYAVNAIAPLGLVQAVLPLMSPTGTIITISSDAAVGAYPGWGGYGSSKAALDRLTLVLAAELAGERPGLRVYAVDPGDMATAMQQEAYPGEDISDRPAPETVVPALLGLLDGRPASGRYAAADLVVDAR